MPGKAPKGLDTASSHRLVVAGGGTGGHLFPGIAVAQAFVARNPRNRVLFINAGRSLEIDVLSRLGWPQQSIPIEGIKGRSRVRQVVATTKIPWATWCAGRIIKNFGVDVILGVGGYSAGPVVVAGRLLGIPTALHEQNRLPGITNRILGRLVDRIFVSFADSADRFDAAKLVVSGNPVRDEIIVLGAQSRPPKASSVFTVFVLGGSLGAHAINQAMVDALPKLKSVSGLQVVHQTGFQDESQVASAYVQAGVPATVQAFFNDMARQYQQADLIVCRAGATTVAEITTVGRAAIFVPFPFAADDHQAVNARVLVAAGAAELIPQTELDGPKLADMILDCMNDRDRLAEMAANARSLGRPEAALTIVRYILELIEEKKLRP